MFPPGVVELLDSGTAAGAQGLVVVAAAEAAARGAELSEVAKVARQVASRVRLMASVERLDHLARSGRVPGIAAWAGNSLGLRMIFEFVAGGVRPRRPVRSAAAARRRIIGSVNSGGRSGLLHAAVMDAEASDEAELLTQVITAEYPCVEVLRARFSSVMVAHAGPGLVGAAWWWDSPSETSGGARP